MVRMLTVPPLRDVRNSVDPSAARPYEPQHGSDPFPIELNAPVAGSSVPKWSEPRSIPKYRSPTRTRVGNQPAVGTRFASACRRMSIRPKTALRSTPQNSPAPSRTTAVSRTTGKPIQGIVTADLSTGSTNSANPAPDQPNSKRPGRSLGV